MVKTWDRDVLCIPKGGRCTGGGINFRGRFQANLARSGLIGKLHLTSEMSDQDVEDEIRTIFRGPMLNNSSFPFLYLQSTGGGSKTHHKAHHSNGHHNKLHTFLVILGPSIF